MLPDKRQDPPCLPLIGTVGIAETGFHLPLFHPDAVTVNNGGDGRGHCNAERRAETKGDSQKGEDASGVSRVAQKPIRAALHEFLLFSDLNGESEKAP